MSGLEQAIRNALERAERANPEIRSRIYQSARNALDTGLRKQEVEDQTIVDRQRQRLEITIRGIEDEELARLRSIAQFEKVSLEREPELPEPEDEAPLSAPDVTISAPPEAEIPRDVPVREEARAVEPEVSHPSVAMVETPAQPPQARTEPELGDDGSLFGLSASRDDDHRSHPVHEEEDPAWAEPSTPEGQSIPQATRSRKRRAGSVFVSLFVYSVLIGIVIAAVWWVYATGMLDAAMKGNGDFDLIPKELQTEDFDPKENPQLDTLHGFSVDWVDIYKPAGLAGVTARSKADITEVKDSDGTAVRLASGAPDQDGEVLIEVPAEILQRLAGKTSTLALTVKSDSELPAQIYVQCEFSTLGDCGRFRFTVTSERKDELIQVKFDGKLGPNDPGRIVINTDLTGENRAIRLYGIRVLPGS